ncbi:hypothetical protein BDV40DRAFT_294954 [Aspergillus tamarii]|uniref:Uncharacterized protein n=1 Tax=Aspergillus tamarii TaxID=41984 RepID=A0A5N6V9Y6_ASPTM|nr:hypothetical protein BDV40DRAFT_294954 [Aspergillus tamarii]
MICRIVLLAAGAALSLVAGHNSPEDSQTVAYGEQKVETSLTLKNCCSHETPATVTATVTDCGKTAATTVTVTTAVDTVTLTVTSTITTVGETVTETITDMSIITEATISTTTTCSTMGNGGPEKRWGALTTTF